MHDESSSGDLDVGAELLDVAIPALMDAMRIDRALATLTGMSRSEVARIIESGAVLLDGVVVTKVSTASERAPTATAPDVRRWG